jgi:hypothetical protein
MAPFWRPKTHRGFVTGFLCGGVFIGIVWFASAWWDARKSNLPSVDELFPPRGTAQYDRCLVAQMGDIGLCDKLMRMRDAIERLKKDDH